MAGWTVSAPAVPIATWRPGEGHPKTQLAPAVPAGQHPRWIEIAQRFAKEFAEEAERYGWGTKLAVHADNGTGDTNGVGVLTMTFTTS